MPSINIYLPDDVYNYIASKGKAATVAAEMLKEQVRSELAIPERLRRKN